MRITSIGLKIYISIAISFVMAVLTFLILHVSLQWVQLKYVYDIKAYNMFTTFYFLISVIIFTVSLYMLIKKRINYIQMLSIELASSKNKLTVLGNDEISTLAKSINQARESIEREYAEKQQMIAGLSHDLRTPLTSMIGYLDLLSNNNNFTPEQLQYLEIVKNKTNHLSELQQILFEYIKITDKDCFPNNLKIDISLILKQCIIESIPEFEKRNIKINFDNIIVCQLESDIMLLVRIFENIISNGLKYAISYFTVNTKCINGKYSIIFENDTTQHIDSNKAFQRFYTGDNSRSNGSSGLGLAIVHAAIEKLGGSISLTVKDEVFSVRIDMHM